MHANTAEQHKPQPNRLLQPGDTVRLKLTGEEGLILVELSPEIDEEEIGPKFLIRTREHKKKQVFSCEIEYASP